MSDHTQKICRRCLLRDLSEADRQNITKYKDAIKKAHRVSEETYETRLAVCKECEKLHAGTCSACGCYVELRALTKNGTCPHRKWSL